MMMEQDLILSLHLISGSFFTSSISVSMTGFSSSSSPSLKISRLNNQRSHNFNPRRTLIFSAPSFFSS